MDSQQLPLNFEFMGNVDVDLEPPQIIGSRIIWPVAGGSFEGPDFSGKVLPNSGDWMLSRPDGTLVLDVRGTMETDDGALIFTHYHGYLVFNKEMQSMTPAQRAEVDPSEYYFRIAPRYEASDKKYLWLNDVIAIGVGKVKDSGVFYSMYRIT